MGSRDLVIINANARYEHHVRWAIALKCGIDKHGVRCEITTDANQQGDTNIIIGPWYSHALMKDPQNVLMLDRCFFNDPEQWASLGWLNKDGSRDFKNTNSDADRWTEHGPRLRDWNTKGVKVFFADYGFDEANARIVLEQTGAYFRKHPESPAWRDCPTRTLAGDLQAAFAVAGLAIGWKTTCLPQAVIAGVPTITLDETNVAWPVSGHVIADSAPTPDRKQWANDLAYSQWSLEDFRSGNFWEHLTS